MIYVGVLLVFFTILYVRMRFWSRQPVRHWWSLNTGVIASKPPDTYVDRTRVTSYMHDDSVDSRELIHYIRKNEVYFPNDVHLKAYFAGAYISVYKETEIEGCIVSRPVNMVVDNKRWNVYFHECMAASKTDVSRTLICTHESGNKKKISVFSSPTPIWFVVPMLRYEVRWIQTKFCPSYNVRGVRFLKITDKSLNKVVELWNRLKFKVQLVPTIQQLTEWIRCKVASVYIIRYGKEEAFVFFKNTMMVEHNKSVIDCCCAVIEVLTDVVFKSISTLFYRLRRVYSIVRLHVQSHLSTFECAYYKKTALYYYGYGFSTKQVNHRDCFVF